MDEANTPDWRKLYDELYSTASSCANKLQASMHPTRREVEPRAQFEALISKVEEHRPWFLLARGLAAEERGAKLTERQSAHAMGVRSVDDRPVRVTNFHGIDRPPSAEGVQASRPLVHDHGDADDLDRLVTVCDECLQARCWHGESMCDSSRSAGTVEKTVAFLQGLGRESPHHFSRATCELYESKS